MPYSFLSFIFCIHYITLLLICQQLFLFLWKSLSAFPYQTKSSSVMQVPPTSLAMSLASSSSVVVQTSLKLSDITQYVMFLSSLFPFLIIYYHSSGYLSTTFFYFFKIFCKLSVFQISNRRLARPPTLFNFVVYLYLDLIISNKIWSVNYFFKIFLHKLGMKNSLKFVHFYY